MHELCYLLSVIRDRPSDRSTDGVSERSSDRAIDRATDTYRRLPSDGLVGSRETTRILVRSIGYTLCVSVSYTYKLYIYGYLYVNDTMYRIGVRGKVREGYVRTIDHPRANTMRNLGFYLIVFVLVHQFESNAFWYTQLYNFLMCGSVVRSIGRSLARCSFAR